MILVFGTTGELIKLAPVIRRLRDAGVEPALVCTGQQPQQIPPMCEDMGIPQPHVWIGRGSGGHDLERSADIPGWAIRLAVQTLRQRKRLRAAAGATGSGRLVVVHGDTFTTVIGALIGKLLGADVAHVEAGLRSGSWRSPFPEELNRRLVSRLTQLHLCPGDEALANLRAEGTKGELVDTVRNTVFDNLFDPPKRTALEPPEHFGLVSIHRFELLRKPDELRRVLEILKRTSERDPLLFIDHPITAAALKDHDLEGFFDDDRFRRVPRQGYHDFISLLRRSAYLVTDSGGSQEECGYIGHPCVVHRDRSERSVGLDGGSVLLTGGKLDELERFLEDPQAWRRDGQDQVVSPSDIAVKALIAHGA